ncbi:hypothetical protein [Micromonospora sp. HUAS LYJ1]|uniref:hypothetical protein n=1 Tax=Micromonospora sp. HUAS LYJ1 TaxID=3061626 RepID=UPI0026725218|nr:hypothetical protein [Micromonospora sp. HUAS LYJ1]WKU03748.1 hypothetical protein Q2K16_23330 [Micromonospora sp. HUAS LYJ1]
MTQPAQQPQTAPPAAPTVPQGQPAQQPPSQPPAQPAPYTPQAWPGYAPPTAPPQQPQPAGPAWLQQPQVPGQPPTQPAPQQPHAPQQPYPQAQPGQGYPVLPAAYPPPPAPADGGDDGQGYDFTRLPKGAREEIERLRARDQQHTTQLKVASVSQQAWALAPQLGVNPQALVGSLAWQQAAAQLNPAAPDYAQRLTWTIQAVLTANPWMAAPAAPAGDGQGPQGQGTPPSPPMALPQQPAGPARSGGDFSGGPAGGATQHVGTGIDRLRHAYSQQT